MRVLSLGFAMPHLQVDNFTWASAPSFFDYDAAVINPAAVSDLIEGICDAGEPRVTYNDEPIVNGPTSATEIGLRDHLERRREEIEALLNRGGLIICFAHPDVPHPRVAGFTGCHRYYWLPAPPGATYGRESLRPAQGAEAIPADYEHPFAELIEAERVHFRYRARLVEGPGGLLKHGKVIGRSTGGLPLAADLKLGNGRLIFLPAFPDSLGRNERSKIGGLVVTAVRNLLLTAAEGPAPRWLSNHSLPGIEAANERLDKAEDALATAETEVDEARAEFRAIDRFRRILWQDGKLGLDLPVRDVLSELGFKSYTSPDDPAVFSYDDRSIFLETEGSSEAVGMEPHYRLRQRLETKIAEGSRPLGLVVINGFRDKDPDERAQQYTEPLRVAAESMRYCVVEASQLFKALQALKNGDEATAQAFCQRLLATEGVFSPEGGEQADEEDRDD